ncbi:S24 family peptidase [Campylobacter molothri]|uniref:S24 family peptidase n=1 Tax=Campylobacter TaxID=194 RepID=UPI001D37B4AE|nr:S24 family peptidase [Campylobacter sp. W0045]
MDYIFDKNLFNRRKKELNLTNKDIAKELNLTKEAIDSWGRVKKNGKIQQPDFELIPKLSILLKIDKNELGKCEHIKKYYIEQQENQVEFRYFSDIYASAGFGTSSQNEEFKIISVNENFLKEILDIPIKKTYDIIKIYGESMEPILLNGDFVIVDRNKNTLATISNADIVIFRKGDDLFCKKIKKQPFEDFIFLVSENKKYKDRKVDNVEFEKCEILGTVVSKMTIETFKNFIEVVG